MKEDDDEEDDDEEDDDEEDEGKSNRTNRKETIKNSSDYKNIDLTPITKNLEISLIRM